MEDGLWPKGDWVDLRAAESLNPCSNGRWSLTAKFTINYESADYRHILRLFKFFMTKIWTFSVFQTFQRPVYLFAKISKKI